MLIKYGYCMQYSRESSCADYRHEGISACWHCFEYDSIPAVKCDNCGVVFRELKTESEYQPGKDLCTACGILINNRRKEREQHGNDE